jgi:uncharacterized lipoprotein NlpE involved in copper resistance
MSLISRYLFLMILIVAAISCSHKKITPSPETISIDLKAQTIISHQASRSSEWTGVYRGTLPCADCEGIETELTLNKDNSFLLKTIYLGKGEKSYEEKGTFSWNVEGNTIVLSGTKDRPRLYFMGENEIIQLDMEGNKITGSLSDHYILKKTTAQIPETSKLAGNWELNFIAGQSISFDSLYPEKKPNISFDISNSTVSGNTSCNNFNGRLNADGNKISFNEPMAMTRMICMDGNGENVFMETLKKINSYSITDEGKTLIFIMGDIAMMRFTKK